MGKRTFILSSLGLLLTIVIFEVTEWDIAILDHFYHFAEKRWLDDPSGILHLVFYKFTKVPIVVVGLYALVFSIIAWKKKMSPKIRKPFLIIALTCSLLPLGIALIGKNLTNVHCPDDTVHYNGKLPNVKLFEKYPVNPDKPDGKWRRGHCFPGGHASGGFALFSLVLIYSDRKHKILSFLFAFTLGWMMAIYQMFRGLHFLSHQLTTMFLALMLVSFLNLYIKEENNLNNEVQS